MSGNSSGAWFDAKKVAEAALKALMYYEKRCVREYEDAVQAEMSPRKSFFNRGTTRKQAESLPGMGIKRYFMERPRESRAYARTEDLALTAEAAQKEWENQLEDDTTGALIFVCSTEFRMIDRFYDTEGPEMPPAVEEIQK